MKSIDITNLLNIDGILGLQHLNETSNYIDYILNIIKPRYIKEHIKINNQLIEEMIDIICKFDINEERLILKLILTNDIVDIESWFLFCGEELKSRWNEIIKLTNDNISILSCDRHMQEMLDYLKDELAKTKLNV
jgi:hypothetical protein